MTPLSLSSGNPLFRSRISVFHSRIIDLLSGSIPMLNLPLKLVNQSDPGLRVKVVFFSVDNSTSGCMFSSVGSTPHRYSWMTEVRGVFVFGRLNASNTRKMAGYASLFSANSIHSFFFENILSQELLRLVLN